jgi:hypothetical protein
MITQNCLHFYCQSGRIKSAINLIDKATKPCGGKLVTNGADIKKGWLAETVRSDLSWQVRLTPVQVEGFKAALNQALAQNKPFLQMTTADFPLSADCLQALSCARALTQGPWGFSLVKGFPVHQWTEEETRLAYWGIGLHLGVARPQNINSDYLTDVRDSGGQYHVKGGRGYNTRAKLDFHIDSGDVVGLMCRRTAKQGGQSKITSSKAIYQAVKRLDPSLVSTLSQPICFSWQGAMARDDGPYFHCPVVDFKQDYFAFRFNLKNIVAAQRDFKEIPRLSEDQLRMIDLLESLFPDPAYCYSMALEPGDLQLVNNYHVIHSRTEFEDHEDPDLKRHLIRLWLCIPNCPAIPDSWAVQAKQTTANTLRGGLRGSHVSEAFLAFEQRQAKYHGLDATYYREHQH